jgi:alpha-N-arabinofuranosidase
MRAAGLIVASKTSWSATAQASTADSRIEVLFDEPLGTISPNIYGHFTENLSGVFYDGIWVGERSKVPNTDGLRNDVIEHMRKIKAPVVRFPGGCFADSYDWRDGIGPRDTAAPN